MYDIMADDVEDERLILETLIRGLILKINPDVALN